MTDEGSASDSSAEHDSGFVRRLNEFFYQSNPAEHITRRAAHMVAMADNSETPLDGEFAQRVLDGFSKLEPPELDESDTPEARTRAVTVEALVLGFQATEAYLRQLLAHWDALPDGSPWFEIAAQPTASRSDKFEKRIVEVQGYSTQEMREMVRQLFVPHLAQAEAELGRQHLDAFIDSVCAWNRFLIGHYFRFRNTYNAAKHGLATIPSDVEISFAAEQQGSTGLTSRVLMAGPALETLEYEYLPRSEGGGTKWQRVTQVFDPAVHVRIALFAADLLSHVWKAGRLVHVGTMAEVYMTPRMSVADGTRVRDGYRPGRTALPIAVSPLPDAQKAAVLDRIVEDK